MAQTLGSTLPPSTAAAGTTLSDFWAGHPPTRGTATGTTTQSDFLRGTSAPGIDISPVALKRPDSPVLAYVDRASMPGYVEPDEYEGSYQQTVRDREVLLVSTWQGSQAASSSRAAAGAEAAVPAAEGTAAADAALAAAKVKADEVWEAELLEWKRRYGCPDTGGDSAPSQTGKPGVDTGIAGAAGAGTAAPVQQSSPGRGNESAAVGDLAQAPAELPSQGVAAGSGGAPAVSQPRESIVNTDIAEDELKRKSLFQQPPRASFIPERTGVVPGQPSAASAVHVPRESVLNTDILEEEMKRRSLCQQPLSRPSAIPERQGTVPDHVPTGILQMDSDTDVDILTGATDRRSLHHQPPREPAIPEHEVAVPADFVPRESMINADISAEELRRRSLFQDQAGRPSVIPEREGTIPAGALARGSMTNVDISEDELMGRSAAQGQAGRPSVIPERVGTVPTGVLPRESVLNVDISAEELRRQSLLQGPAGRPSVLPERQSTVPAGILPRESVTNVDISEEELKRRSLFLGQAGRPSVLPEREGTVPSRRSEFEADPYAGGSGDAAVAQRAAGDQPLSYPTQAQISQQTAQMLHAFAGTGPLPAGSSGTAEQQPAQPPPMTDVMALQPLGQDSALALMPSPPIRPITGGRPPSASRPASAGRPPSAGRPASAGRRYVYTKEDLDVAIADATRRLGPGGTGMSGYSEAGLQKRDFFFDLRKQRDREKGRQATGPLWVHLSAQAKNLASSFDLNELLEATKLFCSVRYDDYELYMRLLGEVPHYVKQATADQLCELIRLLARRRLRERNYVEMATAHLLQKIRVTDDTLPARLLVKTANSLAALECRSQPKFVEHFLRHMEHRVEELDAPLCCQVSPVFVANYMSDALRRAYLKRCAEMQAGFHGPLYELRNLACTELVLRKEHHSFLVSLPAYVGRFLEKVRQHAAFDKWGSVTLPPASAPDGPKGSHRSEMSASLQMKASTATGGQRGDVFNSDMHRDISACLTHLGIEHENGVLCGPYLLDVVALDMENPARRIVYEINCPHHYYEGTKVLTSEKRLRHRMLGRLGQKLHMVNAEDWRPLTAAQKMTFMLKLQQAQQDENSKEAKQQAAANTMRAPLPALKLEAVKPPDKATLKLKSVRDLNAPIRVPVPPSQRNRQALSAR